jgi:hypothetical protein
MSQKAHPALKNTKGAAVAIAQIDRTQQTVCLAGIGNISGVVLTLLDLKVRGFFLHRDSDEFPL